MVARFEVYWVNLDPTVGSEIQKTRPCVVVSPDSMHKSDLILVVPLTHTEKTYPTRIPVQINGESGFAVLEQIRAIDKKRLKTKIGTLDNITGVKILAILREIFEN